jgi:AraC-like DNA-binding protein
MADVVPIPVALFALLARVGLDVDAVLRRAKLARSRFNVPRPQATTAEFFALWRAVEETVPEPDLGLRLGAAALEDSEDVVALAMLNSASLGEGLQKLARYKRLTCPEEVSIEVHDGEARLRFDWLLTDEDAPTLLTDLVFAWVLNLARRGTKTAVRPRRIELTRRAASEAALRLHFGCEIRFDAPHDLIVFDEQALGLPMVGRNAQLLAVLVPGLELAIAQDDQTRTLVDDLRRAIGESMCGDRPAIPRIARALGMSARTLQRRLGHLGTTYQDILDDVRRQSAQRLLANTALGLGEVAFLLGFEEVNSFARAFHAWEGTTPARWRERASHDRRRPQVRGAAKVPPAADSSRRRQR